jgi:hypothetical protein
MMRMLASRIRWYSLSESVCAGATVMESPVCTPIGSRFSMEQMMTTLSFRSRITSSSYSFHPMIDSSQRIVWVGESWSARRAKASNSWTLKATPPPSPPSVKDGRMMTGYPISSAIAFASAQLVA